MTERILPDFDIGQIARSGAVLPLPAAGRGALGAHRRRAVSGDQPAGAARDVRLPRGGVRGRSGGRISIWTPDYGRYKAGGRGAGQVPAARGGGGRRAGLRILRQDLWETIVCFIISQQNNIARITGCVERLCERFGAPLHQPGRQGVFRLSDRSAARRLHGGRSGAHPAGLPRKIHPDGRAAGRFGRGRSGRQCARWTMRTRKPRSCG